MTSPRTGAADDTTSPGLGASPAATSRPFDAGTVSLRLYPHNELSASGVIDGLCAQAALAVRHGFDGVMTSEHHGGFAGYLPNPLQVTGWQLGAMSGGWAAPCPLLLPLRPVAQVAEETAWLDARFPGRVGLGVGPGSLELDFTAMDADLADAVPRFKADLPRLAAMLRGDDLGVLAGDRALGGLSADGREIPLVTTAMSPAAARRAGALGAGVIYDGASVVDRLRRLSDAHRDAGGRGRRVLVRRVWLGEPPAEAFAAQFAVYEGYTPAERQAHWSGSGWLCHDDPAVLADWLATALVDSGADSLNLRLHAPGVDPSAAADQIVALGDEVLPRLRALLRR